jgi:hypothetical protein
MQQWPAPQARTEAESTVDDPDNPPRHQKYVEQGFDSFQ